MLILGNGHVKGDQLLGVFLLELHPELGLVAAHRHKDELVHAGVWVDDLVLCGFGGEIDVQGVVGLS